MVARGSAQSFVENGTYFAYFHKATTRLKKLKLSMIIFYVIYTGAWADILAGFKSNY